MCNCKGITYLIMFFVLCTFFSFLLFLFFDMHIVVDEISWKVFFLDLFTKLCITFLLEIKIFRFMKVNITSKICGQPVLLCDHRYVFMYIFIFILYLDVRDDMFTLGGSDLRIIVYVRCRSSTVCQISRKL